MADRHEGHPVVLDRGFASVHLPEEAWSGGLGDEPHLQLVFVHALHDLHEVLASREGFTCS